MRLLTFEAAIRHKDGSKNLVEVDAYSLDGCRELVFEVFPDLASYVKGFYCYAQAAIALS